jgi:hypothetical protein
VVFVDGTSLTVGPSAALVIEKYSYDPQRKIGELTLNASQGAFHFVGGAISKSADVTIKTPSGDDRHPWRDCRIRRQRERHDHGRLSLRQCHARHRPGLDPDRHTQRLADLCPGRWIANAADPSAAGPVARQRDDPTGHRRSTDEVAD